MKVLLWHVHGSWTTAFVQGSHEYLLPVTPDRGPDGLGRARTWNWPASAREVGPEQLREEDVDVVVLQRVRDLELVREWLGREPGRDLPAVFLEHNAPDGAVPDTRHPLADRSDIPIAHVTHFNDLFWDAGTTSTRVIEHGIVDPGPRYTGELPHAAVVINEANRRARVTGTDLLQRFAEAAPVDLFGMDARSVAPPVLGIEDLPQDELHDEMARRRVYLHPIRWTSLGLSLLEAMHLGMPVVAVGATEVHEAVPAEAGVVSTKVHVLADAVRRMVEDPQEAHERGAAARTVALERYGLGRFLRDWDELLKEVTA